MSPHYDLVAARARHRCEYCHAPEAVFNFPFEVEHIVPLVRDGADTADNWALSCRSCNVRKWAHVDHRDPVTGETVHLYHPRKDSWEDHFTFAIESGFMEGLTAVGRATIARLHMNSPAQCAARRLWIRLGLFP